MGSSLVSAGSAALRFSFYCLIMCQFAPRTTGFVTLLPGRKRSRPVFQFDEKDSLAQDALERTAAHLEKLQRGQVGSNTEVERLMRSYLQQSANALKEECKARKLPRNGRKPDLALRLAEDDVKQTQEDDDENRNDKEAWIKAGLERDKNENDDDTTPKDASDEYVVLRRFAGLPLSHAAGTALGKAGFTQPTPIQQASLKRLSQGESLVLHAETGSGKSLAYLLPITEALWKEEIDTNEKKTKRQQGQQQLPLSLILTPTRELAAQVAGVATVLAPPGMVRLVPYATNLASDGTKDKGEVGVYGGRAVPNDVRARVFVGSAKAVLHSLYGDGGQRMPASPTPKPLAAAFLSQVGCLVLDEVDRCLNVAKSKADVKQRKKSKQHERPAAILSAAVERSTLGQVQVIAASATVGRPLKRELARVLGLLPHECPPVVRGEEDDLLSPQAPQHDPTVEQPQHTRAVTIPETVDHYIYPVVVDGEKSGQTNSDGKLLTGAFQLIQRLNGQRPNRKMLLVLAKSFGMSPTNVIGALRHFQCQPEPQSLLDLLNDVAGRAHGGGTDQMMEVHRQVSGASGVGESIRKGTSSSSLSSVYFDNTIPDPSKGYLLVTGEDTVRGLHLDGLELVVVVGRPHGPDEYTHIAGRTGRAGKHGKVFSVVSRDNASSLKSWERMLKTEMVFLDNDKTVWERL